jgi:pyruvate/2-oxoglutarate dehydrogenase complex dihydrolipoamide dehydrogenase (E3) component
MAKKKVYDVVILGTGSAGFSAVEAAVSSGASVCVIEKERFGGECPNYACVPSKALLKSAKTYRHLGHVRDYGLEIKGKSFNFEQVVKYRQSVVDAITGGGEHGDRYIKILDKLKVDKRIGEATFVDDETISVNGEEITGKTFVIATGTVDFVPPIKGLDEVSFWGWKKALQAKKLPKSMAIIGGGPVGCEIATFFVSFGVRVILLQSSPVVLNREDMDIATRAGDALRKIGVEVVTSASINEIVNARGGVLGLKVETGSGEQMFAVERIVVATGKRSNVANLNLDLAGVMLDKRGALKTNSEQRTNIKHIFGAGDVDGGMQFTHTAHHEGWVAGYNAALLAKKKRTKPAKTNENVVPRATFIDPEVASVGMTQAQVKEKFGSALVGRYEVAALGRAVTENTRQGIIKVVAHPKTRKLLGAHILSARAGEIIHEAALAIHLNATIDKLASMIHAFPTYSEGLRAAAASAKIEK